MVNPLHLAGYGVVSSGDAVGNYGRASAAFAGTTNKPPYLAAVVAVAYGCFILRFVLMRINYTQY